MDTFTFKCTTSNNSFISLTRFFSFSKKKFPSSGFSNIILLYCLLSQLMTKVQISLEKHKSSNANLASLDIQTYSPINGICSFLLQSSYNGGSVLLLRNTSFSICALGPKTISLLKYYNCLVTVSCIIRYTFSTE